MNDMGGSMAEEWFYLDGGKSLGPISTEELLRRIAGLRGEPCLVWAPGMPDWVDARSIPQLSPRRAPQPSAPRPAPAAAPAARAAPASSFLSRITGLRHTLFQRARHEIVAYFAIAAYLMVWFSALMFYKATILRSVGVEFTPFGIAAVKALILAKFILALEAVKLGDRKQGASILIVQIVKKALLFTLALVVMSIAEEVIVGHFHGRSATEVLNEIGGGTLAQVIATAILMFLVLLPYLAFRRLAFEVGELPELLFTRREVVKRD